MSDPSSPSRRRLSGTWLLSLGLIAIATLIFYNLRTLLLDFDVRPLVLSAEIQADSPGSRLDARMLDNLEVFSYIRSFDAALKKPVRAVSVGPFWMDSCEVRQGDYQKFIQWRKLNPAADIASRHAPGGWKHTTSTGEHAISGQLTAAASGLTHHDAHAYCRACGGRLPTSDEWIAAASGTEQRLYPWGDVFTATDWPYLDPLLNAAQRCGVHSETATPLGLHAMGGMVSEWVSDGVDGRALLHGGNGYNQPHEIYSLTQLYRSAPRDYRSPYVGFRCVYDRPVSRTSWQTDIDAVKIPAGDYPVGIPEQARLPQLLVGLPRNWIPSLRQLMEKEDMGERTLYVMDREVTRREYQRFLSDPLARLGLYAAAGEPVGHSYVPDDWQQQMLEPDLPASGMDWWSARAFASWAGGRLPTAGEWSSALSSGGRNIYAWGNVYLQDAAVVGELQLNAPQLPGTAEDDVTPDGFRDMGGNLSEWTSSVNVADGGLGVLVKGGNYLLPGLETSRLDFSAAVPPGHRSPTIGLRLVFDRLLF